MSGDNGNLSTSLKSKYFSSDRGPDLRTVHPSERKTFEVDKMWEIHKEIARLIHLGFSNVAIAERLGVTPTMVSYTRNSRVVKDKLEIMSGARDADTIDIKKRIELGLPKALQLLEKIIDGDSGALGANPSLNLRATTAEKWLNRGGHPEQRPQPQMHLHGHFDAADIERIKQRARDSGMVLDVKPEE